MPIKSLTSALILLICASADVTALAHAGEKSIPPLLGDRRFPAAWVAADVATDADGSLRADLLHEHTAALRRAASIDREKAAADNALAQPSNDQNAKAVEGCHVFLGTVPENF